LFLPAKATVVLKKSKRGKKRAKPGTTKRGMAKLDETPKKKQKSKKIPDDCLQLKNPPEWEMLVPVKTGLGTSVVIPPSTETEHKNRVPIITPAAQSAPEDHSQLKNPPELEMHVPVEPGVDPSSVIPPSTGTEHESTKPTIASESQLAFAVSSKIPVTTKRLQGKKLPTQAAKSNELTSTSLSDPKPATNQTQNDSSDDNEDDDIHEAVSSDPNNCDLEINSYYDEINARFKPINDWNKDIDVVGVIDIFAAS
jgi:hypothetical protein